MLATLITVLVIGVGGFAPGAPSRDRVVPLGPQTGVNGHSLMFRCRPQRRPGSALCRSPGSRVRVVPG
jgi:hypothetical protein